MTSVKVTSSESLTVEGTDCYNYYYVIILEFLSNKGKKSRQDNEELKALRGKFDS